ncbi:uncharacterized protein LOC144436459 [Glandiceps talaboti]
MDRCSPGIGINGSMLSSATGAGGTTGGFNFGGTTANTGGAGLLGAAPASTSGSVSGLFSSTPSLSAPSLVGASTAAAGSAVRGTGLGVGIAKPTTRTNTATRLGMAPVAAPVAPLGSATSAVTGILLRFIT